MTSGDERSYVDFIDWGPFCAGQRIERSGSAKRPKGTGSFSLGGSNQSLLIAEGSLGLSDQIFYGLTRRGTKSEN